jgi:hypothetical protein
MLVAVVTDIVVVETEVPVDDLVVVVVKEEEEVVEDKRMAT